MADGNGWMGCKGWWGGVGRLAAWAGVGMCASVWQGRRWVAGRVVGGEAVSGLMGTRRRKNTRKLAEIPRVKFKEALSPH